MSMAQIALMLYSGKQSPLYTCTFIVSIVFLPVLPYTATGISAFSSSCAMVAVVSVNVWLSVLTLPHSSHVPPCCLKQTQIHTLQTVPVKQGFFFVSLHHAYALIQSFILAPHILHCNGKGEDCFFSLPQLAPCQSSAVVVAEQPLSRGSHMT